MFWYVVGVDEDGYYQTNTDGSTGDFGIPHTRFFEVGYILKTSQVVTVLNPQEEEPAVNFPDWTPPLDFSLTNQPIDEGAVVVGVEWYTDFRAWPVFLKAVGSDDPIKKFVESGNPQTQMAQVNALRQAEYQIRQTQTFLYVLWWENPPPPVGFIFDVGIRPPFVSKACPTLPLGTGSDVKPPLESAPVEAKTALDAAVDVETPFSAEVETDNGNS